MWWVLLSIAQAPLRLRYVEGSGDLLVLTAVKIGAFPGLKTTAQLNFSASSSTVQKVPLRWSKSSVGNTDVLYLASKPHMVTTTDNMATITSLGLDTLLAETNVWGVCDNMLYLHKLPRHCRRGHGGSKRCTLEGCNIAFTLQHRGTCINGKAELKYGTYATTVDCTRTTFLGEPHNVVQNDSVSQLSFARGDLQFEYNANSGEVHVWEKVAVHDDVMQLVTMVFLALALSAWLSWTRDLNHVLANTTDVTASELWERLSHVAVIVGDCVWIAATVKVYQFFIDAKVFMPENVDLLLGHDVAELYCVWYVGVVALATAGTLYILLLSMVANNYKIPRAVATRLRSAAAVCNAGEGQLCALVTVRWLYESVLLTSLHVATPETIGIDFQLAVGLAVGVCVAAVAGRDCQTLLRLCRQPLTKFLAIAAFTTLIVHVTIFMIYPSIAGTYGNMHYVAIVLSGSITIQVSAAAALFHPDPLEVCAEQKRRGVAKGSAPAVPF